MKKTLRKEAVKRTLAIWSGKVNAGFKARLYNSKVIGLLRYYVLGQVFTENAIKRLGEALRMAMRKSRSLLRRSTLASLYAERKDLGRGLVAVEDAFISAQVGLWMYLETSKDPILEVLREESRSLARLAGSDYYPNLVRKLIEKNELPIEVMDGRIEVAGAEVSNAPSSRKLASKRLTKALKERWNAKFAAMKMACKYRQSVKDWEVQSTAPIIEGKWSSQDEALIVAAQEQVLETQLYKVRIRKEQTDSQCRLCGEEDESPYHIVSGCRLHKFLLYKHRHDEVVRTLINAIAKNLFGEEGRFEEGTTSQVKGTTELYYDLVHQTTEKMSCRKPDITCLLGESKKVWVVEVTVCADTKLTERYWAKVEKYQPLMQDLYKQYPDCDVELSVVAVGALGAIHPSTIENLRVIGFETKQATDLVKKLALAAAMGSARIIKNHLRRAAGIQRSVPDDP